MITAAQCRAGRALAELSREDLARSAQVETAVLERFERRLEKPDPDVIGRIEKALGSAGIVFIPENGGGAGVRLKFNSSVTRRLGVFENEGGIARDDDVPG